MTYYTLPRKTDGSCCEVCGPPEDPCSCPDEYQWYCTEAIYCVAHDPPCSAGCGSEPENVCLPMTSGEVATVNGGGTVCVPNSRTMFAADFIVQEIVSGPHPSEHVCDLACPPWYCIRETTYENTDCTGAILEVRYDCIQIDISDVPSYPRCDSAVKVEILSGPYTESSTPCFDVCQPCCEPDVAYFGKTVTLSGFTRSGSGSGIISNTYVFNGTYAGGGVFNGTLTRTSYSCSHPTAYQSVCYPGDIPPCTPTSTTTDTAASLSISCVVPVSDVPYYRFSLTSPMMGTIVSNALCDSYYTQSKAGPNCGFPIGCSDYAIRDCETMYSSGCFRIDIDHKECTKFFSSSVCSGSGSVFSTVESSYSVVVA